MTLSALRFDELLEVCAVGDTVEDRQFADRALVDDALARTRNPQELELNVGPYYWSNGGPFRAQLLNRAARIPGPELFNNEARRVDWYRPIRQPHVGLPTKLRTVRGSAESNSEFELEIVNEPYGTVLRPTLAAGTWRLGFTGALQSDDPSVNASVGISICVGDEPVVASSATRVITRPPTHAEGGALGQRLYWWVKFAVNETVVLAEPGVLTMQNLSGYRQRAYGVLVAVPEP